MSSIFSTMLHCCVTQEGKHAGIGEAPNEFKLPMVEMLISGLCAINEYYIVYDILNQYFPLCG